jgi:thioredoxin reductase (NADPH)
MFMSDAVYDVLIIGTGPAGITAALYGQRFGLSTVVSGDVPGGSTYMIERLMNYPGFVGGISGTEFGVGAFRQAQEEGAFFTYSRVKRIECNEKGFVAIDANGQAIHGRSAVVATGQIPKRLSVPNAQVKGIHFCSICDGPLFRGKDAALAVIGSGNAAAQHAMALSRIAKRVYLICRSPVLKMDAVHRQYIEKQSNIDVMPRTEVRGFKGLDLIEGVIVAVHQDDETVIPIDGVFMAIGWHPNTDMLALEVAATPEGYLKTDERLMTSLPGLFAAGDVRDTDMRQVLTACADGARAAKHAADYLERARPPAP